MRVLSQVSLPLGVLLEDGLVHIVRDLQVFLDLEIVLKLSPHPTLFVSMEIVSNDEPVLPDLPHPEGGTAQTTHSGCLTFTALSEQLSHLLQ